MKYELLLVPFTGFYETKWGGLLDSADEGEREHLFNEYDISDDLLDSLSTTYEWNRQAEQEISNLYAQYYLDMMEDALGIKTKGEYIIKLDSPKYYNYRNDQLYVQVEFEMEHDELVKKLIECARPYWKELSKIIKENHTSYDGFISFMSNSIEEWEHYMLTKDSPNHPIYIDYIIAYLLDLHGKYQSRYFDEDVDWTIYNAVSSDWLGNATPIFEADSNHKDEWEAFQQKMEELDNCRMADRNHPVIPGLLGE